MPRIFAVSGLDGFAQDWFARGLLTWTSGANAGLKAEVKLHSKGGSAVSLELWEAPPKPVEAGDAFTVTAGCDKSARTCFQRFANLDNFRGFPHVPGVDFALTVPERGKKNDGRSMNYGGGDGEAAYLVGDVGIFRGERLDVAELDIFGNDDAGPFGAGAEEPVARAGDARGVEGVAGDEELHGLDRRANPTPNFTSVCVPSSCSINTSSGSPR